MKRGVGGCKWQVFTWPFEQAKLDPGHLGVGKNTNKEIYMEDLEIAIVRLQGNHYIYLNIAS